MATEATKNAIKAATSFKDTPAPNCHTGGVLSKIKSLGKRNEQVNLKELVEKVKEEKKDIPKEKL